LADIKLIFYLAQSVRNEPLPAFNYWYNSIINFGIQPIWEGNGEHRWTDNDGQFMLYSVGWKGNDTGGKVVLSQFSSISIDIDKSDWIWRFPTKDN
jgi:hypothetical protein